MVCTCFWTACKKPILCGRVAPKSSHHSIQNMGHYLSWLIGNASARKSSKILKCLHQQHKTCRYIRIKAYDTSTGSYVEVTKHWLILESADVETSCHNAFLRVVQEVNGWRPSIRVKLEKFKGNQYASASVQRIRERTTVSTKPISRKHLTSVFQDDQTFI